MSLPIEIVGGGIAGLSAGLALRRSGVPVTVFDAGGYPRHRVCGEFIAGLGPGTVEALGIREFLGDACPHRSVTYFVRERPLPAFTLPGTAWGISRHALDARLAEAFVAAGGVLRANTRVSEGDAPEGRVFAAGRRRAGPLWVGLKVHVRGLALANDFEVHLGERAYMGLSRVETGEVNACGIFASRDVAERGAALLPAYLDAAGLRGLAGRIRASQIDEASVCVTAAPLGDASTSPGDRVLIGDACASIAPFTGNGIAMALQGAELALGPLREYAGGLTGWQDCVRRIASAQRRRFRVRLALSSLLHPFFLERRRQSLLAAFARMELVPFRALYGALH